MNLKPGYIVPSFEACCQRCTSHEELFRAKTQSEAVKEAKKAGWVFTRAFGWLCEDCDRGPSQGTQSVDPATRGSSGGSKEKA